jgi:branched-chain amino acid transport system substrate-binding protein
MLNSITLLLVLTSLVWSGGCGPGAKAPEVILIGATLPETGPFIGAAGPFRALMDTWAEMVNEDGGLYVQEYGKKIPIRFVIYDDESDRDKVQELYERLITEDKVHLLIGPYSSPITMDASTIAEKHQAPMICVEANSDAIYSRGFKWIVGVLDTGRKWSYAYLDMMEAKTDAQTIAFVVEDNLHAKEVYEGAVTRAPELGFTVVFEEIFSTGTEDFGPIIAKLKEVNADIVYVSSFEPTAVVFAKQTTAAGLNPKALHIIHHGGHLLSELGKDIELVTGEHYWMPGVGGEGTDEFEELLERSGLKVEEYPWTAIRMPALQVLRAAIENAESLDPEKLMQALKEVDVMTVGGRLTFADNGAGSMNPFPTQIQNGQYITVWPEKTAAGEYLYPRHEHLP